MELSAWWVLGAFVIGGYAGGLLVALMAMVSRDGGDAVDGGGLAADSGGEPHFSA